MRSVEKMVITVLVDNLTDPLSSKPAYVESEFQVLTEAGMPGWIGQSLCTAHHGLSLFITVEAEGEKHSILFDGGPDDYAIERNGTNLGIPFQDIEAVVLSHGHFDHTEGIPAAIEKIYQKRKNQVPLYAHPQAFVERGIKTPSGSISPLQAVPSISKLESVGAKVHTSKEAELIVNDLFYLSGEIPRNSFERGLKGHYKKNAQGEWEEDSLIIDERFLVVKLKGKGIVIITGCSHAGIINIMNHAKEVFPDEPLYGLVGGLHLVHPNEDLIPQTIQTMKEYNLQRIISGHCTGWRGVHALVQAFGEEIVTPLAVGSRYTL